MPQPNIHKYLAEKKRISRLRYRVTATREGYINCKGDWMDIKKPVLENYPPKNEDEIIRK